MQGRAAGAGNPPLPGLRFGSARCPVPRAPGMLSVVLNGERGASQGHPGGLATVAA